MTSAKINEHADNGLRGIALAAFQDIIDPLIGLLIDAGVTVPEISQVIRDRAVRVTTDRVRTQTGRNSNSRVSLATGLSRSEVARILCSAPSQKTAARDRSPSRRILEAWHDSAAYLDETGQPDILPIFGRRRSFERLVTIFGRGIPVRAMLDELIQTDAVDLLTDQRVRAKCRTPIPSGFTLAAFEAVGSRTRDLLSTLTRNVRHASAPLFESTAVADAVDVAKIPLIRREISGQGTSFINGITSLLKQPHSRVAATTTPAGRGRSCRLGVTIYYFQEDIDNGAESPVRPKARPRQNFRRNRTGPRLASKSRKYDGRNRE